MSDSDNSDDRLDMPVGGDWGEYRRLILAKLQDIDKDVKGMSNRLERVETRISDNYVTRSEYNELVKNLHNNYVSVDRYKYVEMIAIGAAGVILLGALYAILGGIGIGR